MYILIFPFTLSTIDENQHPETYVFLEDEAAEVLFWEILKKDENRYPELLHKIMTKVVGSYSVVKIINDLCLNNKLPYNGFGVVDGDMKSECPNCICLPGDFAPEKMVFQGLKSRGWNNLDARFGVGAGSLFAFLDSTLLIPDHHEWTTYLGNQLKKSKDVVWSIMAEEWCRQCLTVEDANSFIESVINRLCE